MPRLTDPDPELPQLALLAQANAAGLTRHQVRQRVRSGTWSMVARGSYLPEGDRVFDAIDSQTEQGGRGAFGRARIEHIHQAVAAALRNRGTVVTDASAAILHGMPVLRIPENVQLAVSPGRWSGTRSGIDFRVRDFCDDDIDRARVPVANARRSWLDITRFGSLADSLVCGDHALRHGLFADSADVDVDSWRGRPGYRRLRRALPLLDGVRESPLESASFAYFVENRLPLPRLQVEIRSASGSFIARVDFLWDTAGVVGEADGAIKYRYAEDIYAEKRREDAIRGQGYHVVRWGMADLANRRLAARLRGRLA